MEHFKLFATLMACNSDFLVPILLPKMEKRKEKSSQPTIYIARTLLVHSSMPPSFWYHALQMATYLLNILPTKLLEYKSPSYSNLIQPDPLIFPSTSLWLPMLPVIPFSNN